MNLVSGIKNMVSEDNGNTSSMRILVAIVVLVFLGNWTYFNISTGTLASFDWQDLSVIIGALGVKAYQKGKENGGKKDDK
ncbi:hypothetical protein KAX02_03065 [candidate division WOR-3 bacterium]|nr:hypothetical protein [candidate division WOR-3 bacterium]